MTQTEVVHDDGRAHPAAGLLLWVLLAPLNSEVSTTHEWHNHELAGDDDPVRISAVNMGRTTVLAYRAHRFATVRRPPALEAGGGDCPLVGLDATGRPELWETALGTDDKILYSLPRARDKKYINGDVYPLIISISNDLQWRDNLDPAAKDSLYDDSIFFAPYDANELRDILSRRASKAFKHTKLVYQAPDGDTFEISIDLSDGDGSLGRAFQAAGVDRDDCELLGINSDVLSDDVIPLCAAYAAQDKGSARQAIKYLRRAAAHR